MIQLACLLDGGLCIVAFTVGTFVVGWVSKKIIHTPECSSECDDHHHADPGAAAAEAA